VVAHHHPGAGTGPDEAALAARNRALTAWMRRPLPVALSLTASLAGAGPSARRALAQLLVRLPAALARRRPPRPAVESALRRLEAS
jgi:hypothetical protein